MRGRDHTTGKYYEKWARLFVRLDPGLARRRHCLGHLFTSKTKQTEQITSCTSVPNSYSQYSMSHCLLHMIYCVYFGSQVRILAYSCNSRIP
jgi:hypothetical protein